MQHPSWEEDEVGAMNGFLNFLCVSQDSLYVSEETFSAQNVSQVCEDAHLLAKEEDKEAAKGPPDAAIAQLLEVSATHEVKAAAAATVDALLQEQPVAPPAPAIVAAAVAALPGGEKDEIRQSEEDVVHPEIPNYYRGYSEPYTLADSVQNTIFSTIQDILGQAKLHRLIAYLGMCPDKRLRRVLRPDLEANFRAKWAELMAKYPDDKNLSRPRIAFHGTKVHLLDKITETGLKVPDGVIVNHSCDTGWVSRISIYFQSVRSSKQAVGQRHLHVARSRLFGGVLGGREADCAGRSVRKSVQLRGASRRGRAGAGLRLARGRGRRRVGLV
jgi:hypothetical protein